MFGGFAILWALVDFLRAHGRVGRPLTYLLLLVASWVLSFINELIHAKDAWASMPEALILSGIVAILMIVATALGVAMHRVAGHRR